jgi:hypothetical protein
MAALAGLRVVALKQAPHREAQLPQTRVTVVVWVTEAVEGRVVQALMGMDLAAPLQDRMV